MTGPLVETTYGIIAFTVTIYKRHDGILYNVIVTFYMYRMLQCLYCNTLYSDMYTVQRVGQFGRYFFTFIPFIRMSSGRKQFVGRSHVG